MSFMLAGKRQIRLRVLLSRAMKRADFSYELPPDRIAREPGKVRSQSRLLLLDPRRDRVQDCRFRDFPGLLNQGDLIVFNNTRVIPARLYGTKATGGKVEVLVERILPDRQVVAHVRSSKPTRPGSRLVLEGAVEVVVEGREDDLYRLRFHGHDEVPVILERYGHMPLPPYLERVDNALDRERYQTIYAQHPGAVAAPTAGLHFDEEILGYLAERGVRTAFITLHVGAGTFQPVRTDDLAQHVMHRETVMVDQSTCDLIARTQEGGGRVVAVGTTVVRSLESAADSGVLRPMHGETNLFITPGYQFRVVDALLTNFHLPESTLLMLVCAFAGYRRTMDAYIHAIAAGYRFYSYGDAMFVPVRGIT
jgi:S-adenosylmethionine:tRNA ribosyltransferase-isomerase